MAPAAASADITMSKSSIDKISSTIYEASNVTFVEYKPAYTTVDID